jgi:hypothetical protein
LKYSSIAIKLPQKVQIPNNDAIMPSAVSEYPTPLTTTIHNPRLKLLNGLKDGKFPLMTFMALPSVRIAQIVALTGFDGESIHQIATAGDRL